MLWKWIGLPEKTPKKLQEQIPPMLFGMPVTWANVPRKKHERRHVGADFYAKTMPRTDPFMKYSDFGLSAKEHRLILKNLGRKPSLTELAILGAMWSEHCSYKSSKVHLKRFPTKGRRVIQGPGENAGVVDIGGGLCAVFKMESHNHPSFIEPFQGAATGVGGILRDIFTMGARPVASLNSLRFGELSHPKTKFLVEGVVAGIASYGNCMGVPTVGGEVTFDPSYNGNILVNVFNVGIVKKDKIFLGYASGVGNPVLYVGAKTGRDGIQGAIMASESFSEEKEQRRPTVQVGDPFCEKLLLEACLELMALDDCPIVGIQDMGAAGLTSSSVEMASRAGTGLLLNLDKIPLREEGMSPYEIMLSESQERMLIVVEKGREKEVRKIFKKWELDCCIVGKVTDTRRLEITHQRKKVAKLPVDFLVEAAPSYNRPMAPSPPRLVKLTPTPRECGMTLEEAFMCVVSSPNTVSKRWVWEQFDYMVGTDTVLGPGGEAAVIRVDKETGRAIALTVDCNPTSCRLDPKSGAIHAVAECARNLACVGATPVAITDCLNFGNPENPEVMWQFSQAVDGISEACKALDIAVVSGNVSLYNETDGKSIHPTPTIGMLGIFDTVNGRPPVSITEDWGPDIFEGGTLALLGTTNGEDFAGSEYSQRVAGDFAQGTGYPRGDWKVEKAVQKLVRSWVLRGEVAYASDLSEGGLAVALAKLTDHTFPLVPKEHSHIVPVLDDYPEDLNLGGKYLNQDRFDQLEPWQVLFSESPSRVLLVIPPGFEDKIQEDVAIARIPLTLLGKVGYSGGEPHLKWGLAKKASLLDIPFEKIIEARKGLSKYMET